MQEIRIDSALRQFYHSFAKMKQFLLLFCLLAAAESQTSDEALKEGEEKVSDIVGGLYMTLRDIAFPNHKLSDSRPVESRFLMLMPGKVLNYFDYYPGGEYTGFIQNLDITKAEAVVPPHVMEKWFDLADAIPNYNPMNAQDTGKSLASVYASILHETKLKGLDIKTKSETAIYNQAMTFLNQTVADPDDLSVGVPLLTLYERYRDSYNQRRLEMEDLIEDKRIHLGSLNYELWFQRHYPSLQSKVESAYTKWLIFGQKENVELQVTYMDTGSSGTQLEEARMALRASGVSSLDRTRTIYPVSFEPSDWYKYLLPEVQRPSQDQLHVMSGKIQSKISAIDAMIAATDQKGVVSNNVKTDYNTKQQLANTKVSVYMRERFDCLKNESNCQLLNDNNSTNSAIEAMINEADAYSLYQSVMYFDNPNSFKKQLQKEKGDLQAQMDVIRGYLTSSSPYLGAIINPSPLAVANLTDAYRDDQWLQFDYDYDSYSKTTDREETTEKVRAHASFHFLFFSAGGDYSSNKETEDFNQKLSKASIRVKGELLRVNIKRPWFKPEIFDYPDLTYKESSVDDPTENVAFVSPGRGLSEASLLNTLTSGNIRYKLPEYTTGFLLARKIELVFNGLDAETVTSAMSSMSHTSGGGGFLCFHASASVTKTKDTSHVSVKRTANGMSISIPGAQAIGYFTQVVPKFPGNQNF